MCLSDPCSIELHVLASNGDVGSGLQENFGIQSRLSNLQAAMAGLSVAGTRETTLYTSILGGQCVPRSSLKTNETENSSFRSTSHAPLCCKGVRLGRKPANGPKHCNGDVARTSSSAFFGHHVVEGRASRSPKDYSRRGLQCHCNAGHNREHIEHSIFDVANPWSEGLHQKQSQWDVNQAWEVLRNDVLYLDYRARQDVLAIKGVHDKVVEVLNPVVREQKSVTAMRKQLQDLQDDLSRAHEQVHLSEARVEHTIRRLSELESAVKDRSVGAKEVPVSSSHVMPAVVADEEKTLQEEKPMTSSFTQKRRLDVSGPVAPYPSCLKNFWYPVAFSAHVDSSTLIPFDCFEEPWVLFRGADGKPGCIRDECAHRACPLSLGTVVDGQVQCPYHGWEFSTGGECMKMPSTANRSRRVKVQSLPCVESDGMIWVWPGDATPHASMPSLSVPKGYTIHAEILLELPVEHGLLVENLLDLAHAPFTHTSTFAKGWVVPSLVRFNTAAAAALQGHWDPYPIDMAFRPPCMVLSTIGLAKPGQLEGKSAQDCSKHLFQMHACLPSSRGKTRLLYRMALDFAGWAKFVPFIQHVWQHLANQVLAEDLRLVLGQQDRMYRGANVWNNPVGYDKLGVRYRQWRNEVESGNENPPFH